MRKFFEILENGELATPWGMKKLAPISEMFRYGYQGRLGFGLDWLKSASRGEEPQQRTRQLVSYLVCADPTNVPLPESHALRACDPPFNSVEDLFSEFGLSDVAGQMAVTALPPIAVAGTSAITGSVAKIGVVTAAGAPREDVSLSLIVHHKGRIVDRTRIDGTTLTWEDPDDEGKILGTYTMEVKPSSVVHAFANYKLSCYHAYWIGDIRASQNIRRSVYNEFDEELSALRDILTRDAGKRARSRDLESAASWVCWLHGFSPLHLGEVGTLSDGPDIIASSPVGHMVIIECTTSALKGHNKMQNLLDRTERVKRSLEFSGNNHLRVLPLFLTTRSRDEVAEDIELYVKNGITVMTREDVEELINQTLAIPNADRSFENLWNRLTLDRSKIDEREKQRAKVADDVEEIRRDLRSASRSADL